MDWMVIIPSTILIITYLVYFLFSVVLAPLVEELYFRGYLFPG